MKYRKDAYLYVLYSIIMIMYALQKEHLPTFMIYVLNWSWHFLIASHFKCFEVFFEDDFDVMLCVYLISLQTAYLYVFIVIFNLAHSCLSLEYYAGLVLFIM